jgi:hypothetical protein
MPLLVAFAGGGSGLWRIDAMTGVSGEPLPAAARLAVAEGAAAGHPDDGAAWVLRGVTSNERYVTRPEHDELTARQQPLGRPGSTRAALIPIKKSDAWWELPQDERRRIFEERSRHVASGLEYLPAVARRLHHGRDLGEAFDFLTWFEFAPEDAAGLRSWCGGFAQPRNGVTSSARSTFAWSATRKPRFAQGRLPRRS